MSEDLKKFSLKYFASIYLASIGDKIGFDNGDREKNYRESMIIIEEGDYKYKNIVEGLSSNMYFIFIAQGGITGLNLDKMKISDDTIMHLDLINGLIDNFNDRNQIYDNVLKYYLISFKDIEYMRDVLLAGRQTLEAIKNINSGSNWKTLPYNKNAGGSGGPMRVMALGLIFYKKSDLLKLIEICIMITSITHPNCVAFIGSLMSALFTSYAFIDLKPETWIFEFMSLLESNTIDDIIEKIKPSYIEYFKEDKKLFSYKLATYIETNFDNYNYVINDKSIRAIYPWKRMFYYFDNFSSNQKIFYPGAGADDSVIIAYDCLLLSKNNYEKLIYYSMINIGDSDTIGSIASAWYGALYQFKNVPENIINTLDYNKIKNISNSLYNKFYDKSLNI